MEIDRVKQAGKSTFNSFRMSIPVLIGVLLLISLVTTLVPGEYFRVVFTGNKILDPVAGAVIGSVAAGNPLTSYVIGGELLKQGISLSAVTAFIAAWVTVGLLQLPAESVMLGRRFAVIRNGVSFITAIIIALLTSVTVGLL